MTNHQGKLLVIDDNTVALELLMKRLEQKGYETRGIDKSLEVIPALEKEVPDLIILDLFMPEQDGFELTRKLKSIDQFKSIPVIGYSAGFDTDLDDAKVAGCDDVCLKNGEMSPLYESIQKLLSK